MMTIQDKMSAAFSGTPFLAGKSCSQPPAPRSGLYSPPLPGGPRGAL